MKVMDILMLKQKGFDKHCWFFYLWDSHGTIERDVRRDEETDQQGIRTFKYLQIFLKRLLK